MNLEILQDSKKMFVSVSDPVAKTRKVMDLFLKQASQVLMLCQNDFRAFVAELVCVQHG